VPQLQPSSAVESDRFEIDRVLHPVHDPHSIKAAEYREQAEKIRSMARQISLNAPRNQLFSAATHMDMLAEEEERRARQAAARSEPGSEA
jgi:hypothetical protein